MLERGGDIEDRFDPGRDDRDIRPRQLRQVRRDVEARPRPAMHAADAAGREHRDARERGDAHGGGNGRGAVRLRRRQIGEVARARLGHAAVLCQQFQIRRAEPHLQPPADDGDGRRHRATGSHDPLGRPRHLEVARVGHAMGDDRRLQRHHRPPFGEGGCNLRHDFQEFIHGPLIPT